MKRGVGSRRKSTERLHKASRVSRSASVFFDRDRCPVPYSTRRCVARHLRTQNLVRRINPLHSWNLPGVRGPRPRYLNTISMCITIFFARRYQAKSRAWHRFQALLLSSHPSLHQFLELLVGIIGSPKRVQAIVFDDVQQL